MVDVRYNIAFKLYPYAPVDDQKLDAAARHTVVVIGGGPIGMAAALDLGLKGVSVLVLDDHDGVGQGSRAICFSKRALEIADRLGCGDAMVDKGVIWNIGKVFHRDAQLYEFNLLPEDHHQRPAFINLQQPYFEKFIFEGIERAKANGAKIEIRGRNQVTALTEMDDHVLLDVDTPDGPYQIEADWIIACDGASSPTRKMMGLGFEGQVFEDNFLIADVKMTADFPTERWFWFEPSFKGSGYSALLHKQPDGIWRIDFQLGWDIDRKKELKEENIRARVDGMLGPDTNYELEWTSIYTFQCRRMEKFRHRRILFAGDSAHQVSPFGARGANSGIQDIDNLGWKLKLVIDGKAPETLLDTYSDERVYGADENITNSTRSTDFITPKSEISKIFRNAALSLAASAPFARQIVNSGRLSVPCTYDGSSLNGSDCALMPERTRPGSSMQDAPHGDGWLLAELGETFRLMTIDADAPDQMEVDGIGVTRLALSADEAGVLKERYLGDASSAVYLIRPDQHVAGRWETYDEAQIRQAVNLASGRA
ncbi:MAG: FAD-dependent oxidoreductase [Rhizobiaceae bacterium]|nr:FAD-dependent oxidoreductase [Rhizobiaceae bacterium]